MTHTVLHIDASARSQGSASREQSAKIVADLNPTRVIRRDLAEGVPFLTPDFTSGTFTQPDDRSAAQRDALALSDQLVEELRAADTIVIGTAMYNFSIPAVLKAWIDQITRTGVNFTYTENGPKGLFEGKKAIITIASGGTPIGGAVDFASPYLRFALGFIGITDVTILDKNGDEALRDAA